MIRSCKPILGEPPLTGARTMARDGIDQRLRGAQLFVVATYFAALISSSACADATGPDGREPTSSVTRTGDWSSLATLIEEEGSRILPSLASHPVEPRLRAAMRDLSTALCNASVDVVIAQIELVRATVGASAETDDNMADLGAIRLALAAIESAVSPR